MRNPRWLGCPWEGKQTAARVLRPLAAPPLHTVFLPCATQSSLLLQGGSGAPGHCREATLERPFVRQQAFLWWVRTEGALGSQVGWAHGQPPSEAPPPLESLRSALSSSQLLPRHKPHSPSPRTKALPFQGPKKIPLHHPYLQNGLTPIYLPHKAV